MTRGSWVLCGLVLLASMPSAASAKRVAYPPAQPQAEYWGDCTVHPEIAFLLEAYLPDEPLGSRAMRDFRSLFPELFRATLPPPDASRLVADFEPAEALFVAYTGIESYDPLFADIVAEALLYGPIQILVAPWDVPRLEALLDGFGVPRASVQLVEDVPFDSVWLRDYGPKAIETPDGLAYVDTRYFVNCLYDDAFPSQLASSQGDRRVHRTDLLLEGGDLSSNGAGVCFTSTHTLPHTAPGVHRHTALRDWFGCERTVVLEPLAGNAVEHVDMFLVPAAEDVLLLGDFTADQDPANHEILERNRAILERARTLDDRGFAIVRIPMPNHDYERNRYSPVVRSYLNLLIFNGLVLVPVYDDSPGTEAPALEVLRGVFRDRDVVAVEASDLARDNGAIHCITWTMPVTGTLDDQP